MIAVAKSERRFGPTLPDTDDEAVDPESHPIVPDDFVEKMSEEAGREFETFDDALSYAETMPSSTDPMTQRRCPSCGSVTVVVKTAMAERCNAKPGGYKCSACCAHFNEPEPSPREWAADAVERVDTAATHAARLAAALEVER